VTEIDISYVQQLNDIDRLTVDAAILIAYFITKQLMDRFVRRVARWRTG
jgi:hypothetical protein